MFELGLPLQLERSLPDGFALDTEIKNQKPAGLAATALLAAAFHAQLKAVLGLQLQIVRLELAAVQPCTAGFLDRVAFAFDGFDCAAVEAALGIQPMLVLMFPTKQ